MQLSGTVEAEIKRCLTVKCFSHGNVLKTINNLSHGGLRDAQLARLRA